MTTQVIDRVLAEHLGPEIRCRGLERGPLGNGQETWFITTTSPEYPHIVLRVTAAAGPLTWTQRTTEATTMRWLADSGLPVPEVLWVTEGDEIIGRSHLGMERLPGTSGAASRDETRHRLLGELGGALAALHRMHPAGDDRAADALRVEVDRWRGRAKDLGSLVPPLLHGLLSWVEQRILDDGTPAAWVWGDAGLHNVLCEDGRLTALLDWELSHLGHPLEDVAVALWMEGGERDERTEVLVAAYERDTGRVVDREQLDALLVLTAVTRSLMVIEGAHDVVDGRLSTPTLIGLALDLPVRSLLHAADRAGFGRPAEPLAATAGPAAAPTPERSPAPRPGATDAAISRFLADAVLPVTEDRWLRRELKATIALLEANALRHGAQDQLDHERERADHGLSTQLAARGWDPIGDLPHLAAEVERGGVPPEVRELVRQHLVDDLAVRAQPLAPLRARFGG